MMNTLIFVRHQRLVVKKRIIANAWIQLVIEHY